MDKVQKSSNPERQLIQLINEDNNKNLSLLIPGNATPFASNIKGFNQFQNPPIIWKLTKMYCVGNGYDTYTQREGAGN